MSETLLLLSVLAPFVLAPFAAPLSRALGRSAPWLFALIPAGMLAVLLGFAGRVQAEGGVEYSQPWIPALGINLALRLDGLGLVFGLLITLIGALIFVYAGGYFGDAKKFGRFATYLCVFLGAMIGVVVADDAVSLFLFWELTSVSSYLLIGFKHESASSRAAALQALLVTAAGGLALLAGLVLMSLTFGTTQISAWAGRGEELGGVYTAALILVLLGCFTKSAQFPFHFWLPSAMEAPTPASAYLHSATMVKAGVFLLARLTPVLGGTQAWTMTLGTVGAATLLVGSFLALRYTDLKRLLAYTTVAALGLLTMLIGIGSALSLQACMVFVLAHGFYKGALFMVAGAVDHEAGTRDVTALSGLRRSMPWTAGAAALAGLAMMGLFPFFSFIGKELAIKGALNETLLGLMTEIVLVLGGAAFVFVGWTVGFRPFLGAAKPEGVHEAPWSMRLGPLVLATLGVLFSIITTPVERYLIQAGTTAMDAGKSKYAVQPWYGLELAFWLSMTSIALGAALVWAWPRVFARLSALSFPGPERFYCAAVDALPNLAKKETRVVQGGLLRIYLSVTLTFAVGVVTFAMLRGGGVPVRPVEASLPPVYLVAVCLLMMVCAIGAVRSQTRLGAVISLGVVGYGVAVLYMHFSAPDLALTQVLVETLTVVLFVLILYRLPSFTRLSKPAARARDALIAVGFGTMMTVLALAVLSVDQLPRIAEYMAVTSVDKAYGRNVVNTILVDYRQLDTLGEITVLAIASIGVYAVLKLRPHKEGTP